MNLTKKSICKRVADKLDFRQMDVHAVIDEFLSHVERAFVEGVDVELRGFGSFRIVQRKSRIGRNPKIPNLSMAVPEHFAVKFKAGKELKTHLKALKQIKPQ